jgi:hypothetical protein
MSVLGGVKDSRSDSPPPDERGIQSASMARKYPRGARKVRISGRADAAKKTKCKAGFRRLHPGYVARNAPLTKKSSSSSCHVDIVPQTTALPSPPLQFVHTPPQCLLLEPQYLPMV